MNRDQLEVVSSGSGFVAALDQSGGSTPKALRLYGVAEDAYGDEAAMFDIVHAMRSRIITSPSFHGDRVIGAILFEKTMDRQIEGRPTVDHLWNVKHVVPFVKIDRGLADESDGVQLMRPLSGVRDLLARAAAAGVFGTKARSVIKLADEAGVDRLVQQQFEVAREVLRAGLVPILEPEVDFESTQKAEAEQLLRATLIRRLDMLGDGHDVMLKLTLPDHDNLYEELVAHPRVLRVLALSGGYGRDEAVARLARNHGVIASFSRALTEGLSVDQSDTEFDAALDDSISRIYDASTT